MPVKRTSSSPPSTKQRSDQASRSWCHRHGAEERAFSVEPAPAHRRVKPQIADAQGSVALTTPPLKW
jgi:hypothetical protein